MGNNKNIKPDKLRADFVNQPSSTYVTPVKQGTANIPKVSIPDDEFWKNVDEKRQDIIGENEFSKEYVSLEEFRIEAKKRALKLFKSNGPII